ncbi:M24 family metallopeptidase [bacterium]|nr:M24 family metallopeptidase [bacterium]
MKYTLFFYLLFQIAMLVAQQDSEKHLTRYRYDSDGLTVSFHQERRAALREKMEPNSISVFFSNPIKNRSNDVDYEYHQDPNFYYLTGFTEPNAALVILKDSIFIDSKWTSEVLWIPERNPTKEVWDGRRLGPELAPEFLGFSTVKPNTKFDATIFNWKQYSSVNFIAENLYKSDINLSNQLLAEMKLGFQQAIQPKRVKKNEKQLKIWMAELRQIKQPEELVLMQKAIDITLLAQIELMKSLKEEMTEYQTEAIIEYVFKREGAEYPGFPSIQGGGENSCVLHYTSNRKKLANNHLLVSDVGAEYRGYTADVTRTLPVDGVFSVEEKAIYNLVLKAQNAGIRACKPGNSFRSTHEASTEIIAEGLYQLGILKDKRQVRKYFMHGTSHYLGLDVHDWGTYGNLESGNVITVEPGIYIAEGSDCDPKWWNIGVRIEDDILITDSEPINLSEGAPRTIEEIEEMMKMEAQF